MPAVQCDQCDHCFPVPAAYTGQKIKCPKCHALVRAQAPARIEHPALKAVEPVVRFAVGGFTSILIVIGAVLIALAVVSVVGGR